MARQIPWARRNPNPGRNPNPKFAGQTVTSNIDRENRRVALWCENCGRLFFVALREYTSMCQRCAENRSLRRSWPFKVNHIPHEDIIK
jgi:Zn finger protein HypA/HybF involved in hydrogenase expression